MAKQMPCVGQYTTQGFSTSPLTSLLAYHTVAWLMGHRWIVPGGL